MVAATQRVELVVLSGEGLARFQAEPGGSRADLLGTGLDDEYLRSFQPDPHRAERLFAASMERAFVSADGGLTWEALPAAGLEGYQIWTLAVDPHVPDRLYAGTQPAGFFVSEDGGQTFREQTSLHELANRPYWTFPPPPHAAHVRVVRADARVPGELLLGVEEGGILRSRDYGATWEDISGLPPTEPPRRPGVDPYADEPRMAGRVHRDVHTVVRDPSRVDTIYSVTGMGPYKTVDAGATWQWIGAGMPHFYATGLAIHAAAPERVFVTTANARPRNWKRPRVTKSGRFGMELGVFSQQFEPTGALSSAYRSDDGGHTWTQLTGGLPVDDDYMAVGLALHPEDPRGVAVGFADGRVFTSNDAGESWTPLALPREQAPLMGVAFLTR